MSGGGTGGGGLIILHMARYEQKTVVNSDFSKSLGITNSSSGAVDLTQATVSGYFTTYVPDPYTAAAITITDSVVTLNAQS